MAGKKKLSPAAAEKKFYEESLVRRAKEGAKSKAAEKKFNEESLVRRANEGAKSKAAEKAPKPVQGAGNMPLSDAEAAKQVEILKAQNEDKKVKKMNRGGMTKRMMGASNAPESGPTKPLMPPKPKPAPRPKPRDPMAMMKKGGKVRGYGMARGGKACKMR